MPFTDVTSLIGILGLILTLLLMARQTRKLADQTMTANAIAHLDAHYNGLERLHDLNKILLDRPELQPYFIHGAACNPGDPDYDNARLLGEMFADVFDLGLELHRKVYDEVHRSCWDTTIIEALKQPILYRVVASDAPWWPDLRMFVQHRPELFTQQSAGETEGSDAQAPPTRNLKLAESYASSPSAERGPKNESPSPDSS